MASNSTVSTSDAPQPRERKPSAEERFALAERYAATTDQEESNGLEDQLLEAYFGECPS